MVLGKFQEIQDVRISPLDLLPHADLREKFVNLVLSGVPANIHGPAKKYLSRLRNALIDTSVDTVKVVVFGGGTGLSNIIGGDSRQSFWSQNPFVGLKAIFPDTRAVVCVTDDGGSTGELLKDLPLVAIGDMRHVLLSSIQLSHLQRRYQVDRSGANKIAEIVSNLFNLRLNGPISPSHPDLAELLANLRNLPHVLSQYFHYLVDYLFADPRLAEVLLRRQCFGNLLLVAAIYREIEPSYSNDDLMEEGNHPVIHKALLQGLGSLTKVIGGAERAVLPCTSTSALLRVVYTNGVEIAGEHKLETARRGYPVASVSVDYCGTAQVYTELLQEILDADIIVLAPGSLYSSIIPVFKVPGLADAVKQNSGALKLLVSNLWVQTGETDLSIADPERKFHVSDMIRAYEKNIPGGTRGLFDEVLCISLNDVPASVLQRYAVEGKVPIYLDREVITANGYIPIECDVYSREALAERGVIQHDSDTLALAIKALHNGRHCFPHPIRMQGEDQSPFPGENAEAPHLSILPCRRYKIIRQRVNEVPVKWLGDKNEEDIQIFRELLIDILWDHPVIPLTHLQYFDTLCCIDQELWNRDQQWDNVFSFYDPLDNTLKFRSDQITRRNKLETALMIALGESLLGNYAEKKEMDEVIVDGDWLGRVYHLHITPAAKRVCYLSPEKLQLFLELSRMMPTGHSAHYTRLLNRNEGFTPPGLLMGLMYAWYVDNRLASHIEYKMSIMKINQTDLIPEQLKMSDRRRKMIQFYREDIFGAR